MLEHHRYRGRHRAPTTAGRTAARVAVVGGAAVLGPAAVAGQASAAEGSVWDRVAACESSGNWSADTGNGYYGGLQFLPSTWRAFGGTGMPDDASKAEQIRVAQRTLAAQGPGAWPVCSRKAGLTRANGGAAPAAAPTEQPKRAPVATPRAERPRAGGTTPGRAERVATVRVEAGDTLVRLAAEHGTTWRALWDGNRGVVRDPNLIYPGQRLAVPR